LKRKMGKRNSGNGKQFWTEIRVKSTRMCRWNTKRNSCPTTRNGNSQGNGSDSVCYSSIFKRFIYKS
jgi:hypothetical protein